MNNKYSIKRLFLIPVVILTALMTGCYENAWENHISQDKMSGISLAEAISQKPELSTFFSLLKKTDYINVLGNDTTSYIDVLKSGNSFTVFAPTNE